MKAANLATAAAAIVFAAAGSTASSSSPSMGLLTFRSGSVCVIHPSPASRTYQSVLGWSARGAPFSGSLRSPTLPTRGRMFGFGATEGFSSEYCSGSSKEGGISFETKAATADHVLEQLSKLAGRKLVADPEMAKEVLVVSVHDVSLDELEKEIAKATAGQWTTLAGETRLILDRGLRARQEAADYDRRLADIKKNLAEIAKPDDSQKTATGATDEDAPPPAIKRALEAFTSAYPVSLSAKLLLQQDASLFAKMGAGDRIVLSTNPNAAQLPLNGYSEDAVADFIGKYNALQTAIANDPEAASKMGIDDTTQALGGPQRSGVISSPPVKALLIVAEPGYGNFAAQLKLLSAKGGVVYSEDESFTDTPGGETGPDTGDSSDGPPKAPPKSDPASKQVTLSPESTAVMAVFRSVQNGTLRTPQKAAIDELLQPERFDPLSFYPSEAVLQRAHELGAQLVADLPDHVYDFLDYSPKATAAEYMDKMAADYGPEKLERTGPWMTLSPSEPVQARRERMDRSVLGKLIRARYAKGEPSLDDVCEFALGITDDQLGSMCEGYLMLFAKEAISQGGDNMDGMRFYGLLNGQQRQYLASGAAVQLGSLTQGQLGILERMTYGASTALVTADPAMADRQGAGFNGQYGNPNYVPPPETYLTEPTESLSNGLPPKGTLTMRLSAATVAVPVDSIFPPLDATRMAFAELAKLRRPNSGYAQLSKFRVGKRTTINLDFRFLASLWSNTRLTDLDAGHGGSVVGQDGFPDEFKQEIAARLDEIKKRIAANPGRGRTIGPPGPVPES